jgi:MFS family permease
LVKKLNESESAGLDEPGAITEQSPGGEEVGGWRVWLALNASTGALLAAILLVGMGTELWSPLMPKYLQALAAPIVLIALYGSFKDFLEAVNYYVGGTLAARLNTRRALLLFNALPLVGLVVLLFWENKYAAFVALPFIGVWNSISGPATLRVVGDTLAEHRRSMAFSLQSIQKRISNLLAYFVGAQLVLAFGNELGVRAGVALSIGLICFSLLVQYRYMRTAVSDQVLILQRPRELLAGFDPQLKRLLVSDILARWCEGMPRELIILYCVPLLAAKLGAAEQTPDELTALGSAFYVGVLLPVMQTTSLLLYLPIGYLASKAGAAKKPFIGLTFVFFALYPLALVTLGPNFGIAGLIIAFVIGGLREFGEPARKAMITELAPPEYRTQAIGMYWATRSIAVTLAPLVGGVIWVCFGPEAMLWTAGTLGLVGAGWFYLRFAGAERTEEPTP